MQIKFQRIVIETNNPLSISIVIPTYNRDEVLIQTIESLLNLAFKAAEIIVVDQSNQHTEYVTRQLNQWQLNNKITLIQVSHPSITGAMNIGLLKAKHDFVLFVDDDIRAHEHLAQAHYDSLIDNPQHIIAGKVIQPWDQLKKLADDGHQFNSGESKLINHFMGGNFSLKKDLALALGGFDQNFVGVAYRFEKEFADRWHKAGYKILFQPEAVIDHLKVSKGGTREFGEHLTTMNPHHAVGAYYYFLVSPGVEAKYLSIIKRLVRSVITRHHLRRPWYIPITFVAEIRGLIKAVGLYKSGPTLVSVTEIDSS